MRQLKKFNYLDVSDLLREILAHVSSPEEFEKFFNEINKSPDDSQADKEKGVVLHSNGQVQIVLL